MTEALQQAYKEVSERPLKILEIFNEFFGEDKVDMQGLPSIEEAERNWGNSGQTWLRRHTDNIFILVHFPRVKVTNEYDRSTFVNHLYAKVDIDREGKMKSRFTLNRSEYTVQHFTNNYMHSHICSIPTQNFTEFQMPCTGRGPINNTICSLNHEFDEDLWRLFCLELDKFVQVESIAGTPYHRLEALADRRNNMSRLSANINYRNSIDSYTLGGGYRNQLLSVVQLAEFTKYVIDSDALRFTYAGSKFQLAMSPTEYFITISNLFIKWYNKEFAEGRATKTCEELINNRILKECKLINGQIFKINQGGLALLNYERHIGKLVCIFKGMPVRLSFSDLGTAAPEENSLLILNPNIQSYIATKILNVINFRYGNKPESPNEKGVYYL